MKDAEVGTQLSQSFLDWTWPVYSVDVGMNDTVGCEDECQCPWMNEWLRVCLQVWVSFRQSDYKNECVSPLFVIGLYSPVLYFKTCHRKHFCSICRSVCKVDFCVGTYQYLCLLNYSHWKNIVFFKFPFYTLKIIQEHISVFLSFKWLIGMWKVWEWEERMSPLACHLTKWHDNWRNKSGSS